MTKKKKNKASSSKTESLSSERLQQLRVRTTASEASNAATPSAQVVGNAFVEQYYHILHTSPELVYRFYQDSSMLSRPDANGKMSTVATMQGINEKILSLNFKEYKAEIKTADAQKSHSEGVTVLVTGSLTDKDNFRKKFAQSFFLAPQDNGYFVLNDVFRYVDDNKPVDNHAVNGGDSAQTVPSIPDPGYSIYVRNFPCTLTADQIEAEFKKFGPVKQVLESLFKIPESSERYQRSMNWNYIVKKMQSLWPSLYMQETNGTSPLQESYASGEEYHVYRKSAKQHWDSVNSYRQKATIAYSKGDKELASFLSNQGKVETKIARAADQRADQAIFQARLRNNDIENVITIDMHGQHVKRAMKLLKLHLLFGTYAQSIQTLRVITGHGSRGHGKSEVKQSITGLLEKEGVWWTEENRGTLLIKVEASKEYSFMDSNSDTE